MQTFNTQSSGHTLLLATAILFSSLIVGSMLSMVEASLVLAAALGVLVFLLCFAYPPFALYLLVFSMLLSPEFGQQDTTTVGGGGGVTIRLDDLLLVIIGFSWLARSAVDKDLGFLRNTPLNRPIFFYTLACALATGAGMVSGNVKPMRGFFFVLKYIEYFIVFFMTANLVKDRRQVRWLIASMFLTCLIVNLVALSQLSSGKRLSAPFEGEVGEPNTLGGYLILIICLATALCLTLKKIVPRMALSILAATSVVTLLFTLSRSTYAAFFPAVLALCFLGGRKGAMLVVGLFFLAAASPFILPQKVVDRITYTFNQRANSRQEQIGSVRLDSSTSDRLRSWTEGFEETMKRPLLGYGITGWKFLDAQYIRVLVETGVIGFAAFCYLIYMLFRVPLRVLRDSDDPLFRGISMGFVAGLVAMIVHGLGANTFIIIRIMEPFWLWAGIVVSLPAIEQGRPISLRPEPDSGIAKGGYQLNPGHPPISKG